MGSYFYRNQFEHTYAFSVRCVWVLKGLMSCYSKLQPDMASMINVLMQECHKGWA